MMAETYDSDSDIDIAATTRSTDEHAVDGENVKVLFRWRRLTD